MSTNLYLSCLTSNSLHSIILPLSYWYLRFLWLMLIQFLETNPTNSNNTLVYDDDAHRVCVLAVTFLNEVGLSRVKKLILKIHLTIKGKKPTDQKLRGLRYKQFVWLLVARFFSLCPAHYGSMGWWRVRVRV